MQCKKTVKIFSSARVLELKKIINFGNVSFKGAIRRRRFFVLFLYECVIFSRTLIVVTNTLAVESTLVEVWRLVIYWPCHTEARYQTKKNWNNKHLILHKKLMVFRTASTLQNAVFGSVCQVHPPILRRLSTVNSFTNLRCSLYPSSSSFPCFLRYPMQSLLNWKVGFSSLYW